MWGRAVRNAGERKTGNVISLIARAKSSERPGRVERPGGATILFFTGIRYQRMPEAELAALPSSSATRFTV